MKADAVFEGGGVKGVAFIGALAEMEAHGYKWNRVAGTSAGSLVAALLCGGYSSSELYDIFRHLDYMTFLKRNSWARVPIIGPVYELVTQNGLYPSDHIEQFVDRLLRQRNIRTFGDLEPGRLKIIASDITAGKMLILPDDLVEFDMDPASFPIARAVRMSSCIPYFFQPYVLKKRGEPHLIVDGGLLSNFPVWLFDTSGTPRWPTFGFRLKDELKPRSERIRGLISYSRAIISTMLDAHDRLYVEKAEAVRTLFIPTLGVRSTSFDLSDEMRQALFESGRETARRFLQKWDFAVYAKQYRSAHKV